MAQADAARTPAGLHVVRAPYAGVVAEVPVALGDMAMPGRALLTLYEPGALRVTAALPQRVQASAAKGVRVEFPGLPEAQRWLDAAPGQLLPTVDPAYAHGAAARARCRPAWPAWRPAASPACGCPWPRRTARLGCWCRARPWCGAAR